MPITGLFVPSLALPRRPSPTVPGWGAGFQVGEPRKPRTPALLPGPGSPAHLGSDLVAALASLQVHDLPHDGGALVDAATVARTLGAEAAVARVTDAAALCPCAPGSLYMSGRGPRHHRSPARSAPGPAPGRGGVGRGFKDLPPKRPLGPPRDTA
jgi:hypothetical protein